MITFLNNNFKYIVYLLIAGAMYFTASNYFTFKENELNKNIQVIESKNKIDSLFNVNLIEVYKAKQIENIIIPAIESEIKNKKNRIVTNSKAVEKMNTNDIDNFLINYYKTKK